MTRDEIIEMVCKASGSPKEYLDHSLEQFFVVFALLVEAKVLGVPVGRVTGDGAVTWLEPIPEEGADLYAGPFRARGQQ